MVASMSAAECAADTKPASNADGAKYTPSLEHAMEEALEALDVASHHFGEAVDARSFVKKKPNMPHT